MSREDSPAGEYFDAEREKFARKWQQWRDDDRRPLTVAEWAERAEDLGAAAQNRVDSGRGIVGDRWHEFLTDLAALYRHNANAAASGGALEPRLAVSVPEYLRAAMRGGAYA